VTRDEAAAQVARYWMKQAREALASARGEVDAGRLALPLTVAITVRSTQPVRY
jgi:hypothetical protein